jgi:hypothetical protein
VVVSAYQLEDCQTKQLWRDASDLCDGFGSRKGLRKTPPHAAVDKVGLKRPAITIVESVALFARPLNLETSMLELTNHRCAHACDPEPSLSRYSEGAMRLTFVSGFVALNLQRAMDSPDDRRRSFFVSG